MFSTFIQGHDRHDVFNPSSLPIVPSLVQGDLALSKAKLPRSSTLTNNRRVFVGSIGSDCNPIRTVIFPCLTKTDMSIGLAMFCKQRRSGTPRIVHHTESWLKLPFYRSI